MHNSRLIMQTAIEAPSPSRDLHQERRRAILELVSSRRVANQLELVALLTARGIEATQSSVSRDLRFLGVGKIGGFYALPGGREPGAESRRELLETARFLRGARPAGPNLTVVITAVGAAQAVARAFDNAAWPEVVGTLAGDDTIFIATANAADQSRFLDRLGSLLDLEPDPSEGASHD